MADELNDDELDENQLAFRIVEEATTDDDDREAAHDHADDETELREDRS
jgi:hypothetical protein